MRDESINHFLRRIGVESDLRSLLYHLARSCKYINFTLRAGHTGYSETENSSGEQQLALDVQADKIILHELEKSELCAQASSEEQEHSVHFPAPQGSFCVAYDPLDGSSLFDANFSIGSIFGVWEGDELIGQTGRDMVAAVYCIYGPRVMLVVSVRGHGTHVLEMNDVGEFLIVKENVRIAEQGTYFAPGNLRASIEDKAYQQLILDWRDAGRTLRYSGGMVPDVHHIVSKGHGIFTYPPDTKHTNGKLRLSFECMPMSLIFEEAGGLGLTTTGEAILDRTIADIHERCPILIGSADDVRQAAAAWA